MLSTPADSSTVEHITQQIFESLLKAHAIDSPVGVEEISEVNAKGFPDIATPDLTFAPLELNYIGQNASVGFPASPARDLLEIAHVTTKPVDTRGHAGGLARAHDVIVERVFERKV